MSPQDIEHLFTRPDGTWLFARWRRPVVPVVFGLAPESLPVIKGAFEAVAHLAGHQLAETDPEQGVNLMVFFLRDWAELAEVPDLDRLLPDLPALLVRLHTAGANQYRAFRHEADGAIRAAFVFVRMDADMQALPAEALALDQAVRVMLLWSETAFAARGALASLGGQPVLRPDIAALMRAAYDPALPATARDPSHSLRLLARMESPT